MMMILDVVAGQELASELEEIDFRTGEVVYRIREE
jgi:cell division protein FtsQ